MSESREYISRAGEHGDIYISEEVLAMIAGAAVIEIEGVADLAGGNLGDQIGKQFLGKKSLNRGITVTREGEALVVNVAILIHYGYPVPELARKVQEAVISNVEATSSLTIKAVNVRVGGVIFEKEQK